MNETTRSVRALYEEFPYPSGVPTIRLGFDARYLLSLSERCRPSGGPLRVLDAGCGRALGLIGAASLQRDIQFVGADLNRVALAEAEGEARSRGLTNLTFLETNLEELALEERDFDVIHSSGVVHHLTDPAAALRALGEHLAPHGVLALMVYGRRDPVQRVVTAIRSFTRDEDSLTDRLAVGRKLVRDLAAAAPEDATWKSAAAADDVEFVDRYLHPCECSYDIDSLFELIEASGLAFLRWADPNAWDPARELDSELLRDRLAAMEERERYKLALSIHRPGKLELYLGKPGNSLRRIAPAASYDRLPLCVNPELTLTLEHRGTWCSSQIESIRVTTRGGEPEALPPGPLAKAAVLLASATEPFLGADMVRALRAEGLSLEQARAVIDELLHRELVYSPHLVDAVLPAAPTATLAVAG